jgi:hypothetical protein
LKRIALPDGIEAASGGELALRGKEKRVDAVSLCRSSDPK